MDESWNKLIGILSGEQNHPSGRCISFGGQLDDTNLRNLSFVLRESHFCGGLRLKGCDINDYGATILAEALQKNYYLTSIDLPDNSIGARGAEALLAMVAVNRTITGLGLDGNPCKTDAACSNLVAQIDWQIIKNRSSSKGSSSAETSPMAGGRMQRSRARIEEVSPETPSGVFRSPTRQEGFSARGLSFANGHGVPDIITDTGSEPSSGDQNRWYNDLLFRTSHLEDRAEDYQVWQESFSRESGMAMAKLNQLESVMNETRDELSELKDWRGQQEMISDNNSAHIQRQNGDFSGLRDKVIRLHTQFELVTKGGPEALERTLAMIAKASSSAPLAVEPKHKDGGGGDAIVQRVSDLVQGHEAHVNEALEDWRGTISKFTAMMEGHAGIVHSLEASSSQYESRLKSLEKVNTFTEEDTEAVMQQAIEDLQRIQASTAQQVSGFKAELQSLREEVCGSVGECQMSVTEALHRHVEAQLQSVTADQEAVSATKWAACEKAVEEVRRRTERHMAELQASVREGNQRQAELKERVNFHENLIMEEQHGSRNAAVAMSTSERLDSVLVQVQEMDSDIKAVRALREEVGRMKRDQQELLGRQEDRGALEEGLSRAAEEMQAGFAEVREEIAGSSDKAENRLDHLQRSQVYLEQKLLGEIQTKEAALESLIQQTGNRGQEDVQALAQAMEANAQQISRLRSQFASDYNRFGENTTLMQEQLQSVGQSLDAQHANITKVKAMQGQIQHQAQVFKEAQGRLQDLSHALALQSGELDSHKSDMNDLEILFRDELQTMSQEVYAAMAKLQAESDKVTAELRRHALVIDAGSAETKVAYLERKLVQQEEKTEYMREAWKVLQAAHIKTKVATEKQISKLTLQLEEVMQAQASESGGVTSVLQMVASASKFPVSHPINSLSSGSLSDEGPSPHENSEPAVHSKALTDQQNIKRSAEAIHEEKKAGRKGRENKSAPLYQGATS